jgi:hypothetical protein
MTPDEDWEETRAFLAERTRSIRREFALLALPVLLIAAAFGFMGMMAADKPQLQHAVQVASVQKN